MPFNSLSISNHSARWSTMYAMSRVNIHCDGKIIYLSNTLLMTFGYSDEKKMIEGDECYSKCQWMFPSRKVT